MMIDTSLPWCFWLFPVAFAIHNIEEALWLPAWSQSAGRFHRSVGRFEFAFAIVVITAVSVVITILFYVNGKQSLPCYLFFAFNVGMFVNVFVPHLAGTIALKRYCPGLLTGMVLLVPTTLYLLWYGYTNDFYSLPKFWYVTIPFAGLIIGSIPVLFKIGRAIEHSLYRNDANG